MFRSSGMTHCHIPEDQNPKCHVIRNTTSCMLKLFFPPAISVVLQDKSACCYKNSNTEPVYPICCIYYTVIFGVLQFS